MGAQKKTLIAPIENTRDHKMSTTKLQKTTIVQVMTIKVQPQVVAMRTMKDPMRIIQVKDTNKLVQAVAIEPPAQTMTVRVKAMEVLVNIMEVQVEDMEVKMETSEVPVAAMEVQVKNMEVPVAAMKV